MSATQIVDEEDGTVSCCTSLAALRQPTEVDEFGGFFVWPFFGPLLFNNTSSDARDHLALERTFLSYLRLAVTMAVVSVAIVLSFHLKHEPTPLELHMAKPLGAIFWCLSAITLGVGMANYVKTVQKYSRRAAIVQSGWKTQSVMAIIASCIVGACITLLVINKLSEEGDQD